MKSAHTRRHSNLRPKHKHTKKYLKTYFPYMPLLISVGALLLLLLPVFQPNPNGVLSYARETTSQNLLSETNRERARSGKSELQINSKLSEAASAKAQDMVSENYWSHIAPNGKTPWSFLESQDYDFQKAGENLAFGFTTSSNVISGWMNSQSHRENMLDDNFTEVGFGYANSQDFAGNGPATVVVAMYARPILAGLSASETKANQTNVIEPDSPSTMLPSHEAQGVARVQALTKGRIPYINYIVTFVCGLAAMYVALKHSFSLKRTLARSEAFVVHHPLLDTTLISLVIVGILLTRQIGTIL